MADNICKYELFSKLGFVKDPFSGFDFKTSETTRLKDVIQMAVIDHGMISIVGDRGVGKTRGILKSLDALSVSRVRVHNPDRRATRIGDIELAMILDLSEESPARTREIRSRQLRRILGPASAKGQVVVVIEESHLLHPSTLKAVKTLREIEWKGESELFTIIMIGQSDPMHKAGVREVRLRSDSLHMMGMTERERLKYIWETVGLVIKDRAVVERIAGHPPTRNFLDMQEALTGVMARAWASGRNRVDMSDVDDFLGENKVRKIEPIKKGSSGGVGAAIAKHRKTKAEAAVNA